MGLCMRDHGSGWDLVCGYVGVHPGSHTHRGQILVLYTCLFVFFLHLLPPFFF